MPKGTVRRITIHDVAREASVSTTTVSYVVNNNPTIPVVTAARVKAVIDRLKYLPRARTKRRGIHARAAWNGTRNGPFLIIAINKWRAVLQSPVFADIMAGLNIVLGAEGRMLTLQNHISEAECRDRLRNGPFSGLIIFSELMEEATIQYIRRWPCVEVLGVRRANLWWDQVTYDNTRAGELGARYLLEKGHRVCAYIGGAGEDNVHIAERGRVFQRVFEEAGARCIMLPEHTVIETRERHFVDPSRMLALLRELLERKPRPTGIMFGNDVRTAAAYPLLARLGIQPFKDMDIVSCDNEDALLASLCPRPAAVDIHAFELGSRAGQQLMWRMEHPRNPVTAIVMQPDLVKEQSLPAMMEPWAEKGKTVASL